MANDPSQPTKPREHLLTIYVGARLECVTQGGVELGGADECIMAEEMQVEIQVPTRHASTRAQLLVILHVPALRMLLGASTLVHSGRRQLLHGGHSD
eukprot:6478707-Amphidinium_carterae.1